MGEFRTARASRARYPYILSTFTTLSLPLAVISCDAGPHEVVEPVRDAEVTADSPPVSSSQRPGSVEDLRVTSGAANSVGLAFTEVDDGTGAPAYYRVRYAPSAGEPAWPDDFENVTEGECAIPAEGVQVGGTFACDVPDLEPETEYEFGLIAYRYDDSGERIFGGSSNRPTGRTSSADSRPGSVTDLRVTGTTANSVGLAFTEVDDGTGGPAFYRVRYAASDDDPEWPGDFDNVVDGKCALPAEGVEAGATFTCEVPDLDPATEYDFGLIAYRYDDSGERNFGGTSNRVTAETSAVATDSFRPGTVTDLRVTDATATSVGLAFTEVDDGSGAPAYYRVRYAPSAYDPQWPSDFANVTEGDCAIPAEGVQVGATFTCEVPDLDPETEYDFGLIAYRYDETGERVFGGASNRVTEATEAVDAPRSPESPAPPSSRGIWIQPERLASLPTSGSAWENLQRQAARSCPTFDIADQDNNNNTCVMAKALVYARTGDPTYLGGVLKAFTSLASMGRYQGRALALGRNLGAYAIAADLVDLSSVDSALDSAVRGKFRELLTASTYGAASNLVDCHERRPNNWGTHCGGARAAVAAYLGDQAELDRVAQVFRGWLGDRSSYSGFTFGGPASARDHSWECDRERPVGINPAGCRKQGRNLDGVIPDDQRRGGSFSADPWPPTRELYVWEALQGVMLQAVILEQAGYRAFQWEDRAILRAVRWLHEVAGYPADRGNTWQPHVVNYYTGSSFPAPNPTRFGKNVGWTDWTHRR